MPAGLAERLLPAFHFEERHAIRDVEATPERLRAVIHGFDDRNDAWLNALLWLREWPARRIYRWWPAHGIAPGHARFGLNRFTLLAEDDSGLAFGLVGSFWRLNFGLQRVLDAGQFMQAQPPKAAKLVLSFQWEPTSTGRIHLQTVTRIQCTDAHARRLMTLYWTLIRPFSGLIRHRILRQIQHVSRAPARR